MVDDDIWLEFSEHLPQIPDERLLKECTSFLDVVLQEDFIAAMLYLWEEMLQL